MSGKAAPEPHEEGLELGREMRAAGRSRPLLLERDAAALGYRPGRQWDEFRRGVHDAYAGEG